MKKFLLLIIVISLPIILVSQELRCNIQVSPPQKNQELGTNKKVYQTLQTALYEFMNNKAWTSHAYTVNERIVCNILILVQDQISADEFRATIQIQSNRPIYNSSYNSVMLNYKDDNFVFRYVEFETLEFNETTHKSNLTAVLAYYAYMILGFDYDSFSLEGGTEYFTKAEKIVSNAQNTSDKGWKPYDGKNNKNRYWLVKNVLDKRYAPIREFNYRYHRTGLDIMDSKPNEGRTEISESLLLLQKVYREKPDPFMIYYHILFDAKADEFINIYSDAMPDEKTRAFQLLNEIDNANSAKYKKLTGQN